jgi:very-short-patch-repair endonuclease
MKAMSDKGNASPKRLTSEYKETVAKKISDKIIASGRMVGEANPNYGGAITNDPAVREKMRKPKRDSSKMGKWKREAKHRDALSLRASIRRPQFKRTSIEIKMFDILASLGYEVKQEFLIQTKDHRCDGKLFYRHVYDLYVESLNLLIECDGIYWHDSLNARNSDTKASYVANEMGFRVLRLSEVYIKDIANHMSEFLQILTCDSAFSVLGDFYDTIPTRVSVRNSII